MAEFYFTSADARGVGDTMPAQPDSIPTFKPMDISPFKQRMSMLELEVLSKHYSTWRDISRYFDPKRGFFEGFVPNYNAQYDYKTIMDGDPADYCRIMATGMASGLTSPSRPWFRLTMPDPALSQRKNVRIWLDDVQKILETIFAKSNFYPSCQSVYEEDGYFGTGAMGIYEDRRSVIRCRPYTIGEYFLGTDYTGRVNTFARKCWKTVDQLVNEYGWNNVSKAVQSSYSQNQRDRYCMVYYLVEPNSTKMSVADFRGMDFRAVTWEAQGESDKVLSVGGYNEFPIMAPRWALTTSADVYGYGPGLWALGDVKALYRMEKDSLLAINKVADPPIMVDASIEGAVNTLPGGITRSNERVPNAGARPAYQVQPDIQAIEMKMQSKKQQIGRRFYVDLFRMMIESDRKDITAREIEEKHSEKLLQLGPVIGRFNSDLYDPAISRTFNIALRRGLIPPPPEEIQGMALEIQYISILAQAQRSVSSIAIESEANFVGAVAQIWPEAVDNFNIDEAIREHSDMNGAPQKLIRSKEEVDQIRQARAEAQRSQQQAVEAEQLAKSAKTLSDAKVGGQNALERVIENNGGVSASA